MLVGTHHKVGTVLMQDIFRALAKATGLRFLNCASERLPSNLDSIDILFDWHSKFAGLSLGSLTQSQGIHLIRDPRMVVVSAAYYHQRSAEAWLHTPLKRFNGLTYQQKILSLSGDSARFQFEMDETEFTESAGRTLEDMRDWVTRSYKWCINIKLEDLMTDEGLDHYHALFRHLGLKGKFLIEALSAAYANSVFNPEYRSSHLRSRSVEDWRTYYNADLATYFKARFGTIVEDLGYSW